MNELGYILDKSVLDAKGQPPRINRLEQFLVWKFLLNPGVTNWPRELKIAKKLLQTLPEIGYWNFVELDFKIPSSLAWFLTPSGSHFLQKQWEEYEFLKKGEQRNKRQEVELLPRPIGENIVFPDKAKTLFDFIKKKK